MMKQLVYALKSSTRWLDCQSLAENVAKRAVEEGFLNVPRKVQRALNAKKQRFAPRRPKPPPVSTTLLEQPPQANRLVLCDVLDCTLGGGYHSGALLHNASPYTRVVALDCDYEVQSVAKDLETEFGSDRFRFFGNRMSDSLTMFGERSFDMVVIDPGVSARQLNDPVRGFALEFGDGKMDMRYGPQVTTTALDFLNSGDRPLLTKLISKYRLVDGVILARFLRAVMLQTPFSGSHAAVRAIEMAGGELPDDLWMHSTRRNIPLSLRFLLSLRMAVNAEEEQLQVGMNNAMHILRPDGRLVVFTRYKWEEELVASFVLRHPLALKQYSERINEQVAILEGHHVFSIMHVIEKTSGSAARIKNLALTKDDAILDAYRHLSGLDVVTERGFPEYEPSGRSVVRKEQQLRDDPPKDTS